MSRSARITLLLSIDILFFLLEIIVGYAVGSLALVADSFHMLNDIVSLVIALYAIKLTSQINTDTRYSYGWHRAEILAALINGVFLLALCFSITMEAIERFFSVPEVGNPRLVVIVGSFGLASNLLGLFLFHEHSHGHSHAHGNEDDHSKPASVQSSRGASKAASIASTPDIVLPVDPVTASRPTLAFPQSHSHSHSHSQSLPAISSRRTRSPHSSRRIRDRSESYSSLYGHPAATRASLVQTAANMAEDIAADLAQGRNTPAPEHRRTGSGLARPLPATESHTSFADTAHHLHEADEDAVSDTPTEHSPLLSQPPPVAVANGHPHPRSQSQSHGSMNMRAILLHVLGDALGNVGVIATGLIIWLSTWPYKFYCDPLISLIITAIIFHSALPLVRSTSFILLQGVPSEISFDKVRDDILAVDGVLSVHELHIWQLSESKIIASVHVTASRRIDFMPVASDIRRVLHHHGVHSSTIQPEYHDASQNGVPDEHLKTTQDTNCLIVCPPDHACHPDQACCRASPSHHSSAVSQ
ncbi:cation efflux protein [Vararia minispora EC-137]|uniref:Cation efflux protein n=1 Tax=Vararia minispora EC-137 TaxID=1314806 RepID=A0ACB8QFW7_9AGAM|nr:cation efflux protein [Vararia minispora EC-137]